MNDVHRMRQVALCLILVGVLVVAGCAGESNTQTTPGTGAPAPAAAAPESAGKIADSLFVDKAPENPLNVIQAVGSAKEGETIVLRARIGGSREPFVDGRASFTVADMSLKACNDRPGDACASPWDFCCESRAGKVATIQVVGADGAVLKSNLKGLHGLAPLGTIVVEGKVGPRPDSTVLMINAQRIFVEPVTPSPVAK